MQSQILSDNQISRINAASLEILEKTGVIIPHDDMLDRFEGAGATVDREEQRVRIPADLIARSIESAGKQFTLYGRDMTKTAAFGHMGICGVDQATSLDMLVMQNEIIGYVESAMREVNFSDEALGMDVIEEVGPGGNFIDTMHTVENFRKELWVPELLDREYYQSWLDSGAQSMEDRCKTRALEILKEHKPEPLPSDLEKTISGIVTAAKKELSK